MKTGSPGDTNSGTWIGAAVFAIGYFVVMFCFNSGAPQAGYDIPLLFGFVIAIAAGAEIGRAIWSAMFSRKRFFKLKK
ncbi:MAG: hypothetical protein ABIJ15_07310 [bacterium]